MLQLRIGGGGDYFVQYPPDLYQEAFYLDDEDDYEILFEDPPLNAVEKAWRYAKKPLLSIGAKGASFSHGNSLRQLLDAHTMVKVKVNTNKFGKYVSIV